MAVKGKNKQTSLKGKARGNIIKLKYEVWLFLKAYVSRSFYHKMSPCYKNYSFLVKLVNYIYIYIYIYGERERERETDRQTDRQRHRDRERERIPIWWVEYIYVLF